MSAAVADASRASGRSPVRATIAWPRSHWRPEAPNSQKSGCSSFSSSPADKRDLRVKQLQLKADHHRGVLGAIVVPIARNPEAAQPGMRESEARSVRSRSGH